MLRNGWTGWYLIFVVQILVVISSGCLCSCTRNETASTGKPQVVTTLFPLYDFARIIAGDRANVRLLLPPGTEPHSFEPRPEDMVAINTSTLFIYTGDAMEPWAARMLSGLDRKRVTVINASQGLRLLPMEEQSHAHGQERNDHEHAALDPHVWLDFGNAQTMVDTIVTAFNARDPAGSTVYNANGNKLKLELAALDSRFREGLSACASHTLIHGGHYAFGYLSRRYGLSYRSLSGISTDAEPSAAKMGQMVRHIRTSGVTSIFAEELLSPKVTETIAAEAGVAVLRLNAAHNLGKEEFQRNVTFVQLMETNLQNLRKGLQCR